MRSVILTCALFLLSSCGPIYDTSYEIVPPRSETGRMCANNCLLAQQNCRQNCQIQEKQCQEIAQLRAQSSYYNYVNQQQREGRPITRNESDFYHYSGCSNSCEEACGNDYRICHTNCGGVVIPHTTCTAFCE